MCIRDRPEHIGQYSFSIPSDPLLGPELHPMSPLVTPSSSRSFFIVDVHDMLNRYTFMPSPFHTICLQTYSKISLSRADTQHQVDKRIEKKFLPDAWQSPLAWRAWACQVQSHHLDSSLPHRYRAFVSIAADCVPVSEMAQRRHLRSAAGHQLGVSSYHLNSCGLRAFSVLGPRLWNSLPLLLHDTRHNTTSQCC